MVQGTLMRGTIHTVRREDYRLFLGAVQRSIREWAARATKAPANLDRRTPWPACGPSWRTGR